MRTESRHLFRAALICTTLATAACGSNAPTSPTGASIASVTFAGATLGAGSVMQGTVTLAGAAASGGATVALSSSNPSVATVPASVGVAAGATSATFVVTGVSSGSATITASMNGSSRQSPALTVSARAQLASITVSPSTAVGGSNVTATVTLTGPAPSGGADVALSSDGTTIVPASMTVVAGSTSVSFTVLTQVVSGPTNSILKASYNGTSVTATISLTRPTVATANFGVTGRDVTETCTVVNGGSALDCTFNGSTSAAPGNIIAYDWTWAVTATGKAQTTSSPILASPSFSCSMLPAPPLPPTGFLPMTVTLKIHDDAGNVSAVATNASIRLLPQGSCGY